MDLLLVASWTALGLDSLWQARREGRARAALGPVVSSTVRVPRLVGALVLLATLAGAFSLERLSGRVPVRDGWALAGLLLAGAGVWLHTRARRALGAAWSPRVQVREAQRLVTHGPYAHVRHPIYLAVLLLAAGTVLAHPSLATGCIALGLAVGVALKIRLEEGVLRRALGEEYVAYAARTPAVLPRVRG